MSDESRSVRRQRSIYRVHYALAPPAAALAAPWPHLGLSALAAQVAGHTDSVKDKYLGLLQCNNGTVLKPVLKEVQRREVDFYERLAMTTDPDLIEFKNFVPKYFGCKRYSYNGYENEYIVMEDLTHRMLEPCIIDIKIGKRTWDPTASEEKIKSETTKYALSKQQFGFCIPGYQIYSLGSGKLHKYGKDHGKKLHGQLVKDALRNFLNGSGRRLCRALLLQFLSQLWALRRWSARARSLRLYAASLLLAYDCAPLRDCCDDTTGQACSPPLPPRGAGSPCDSSLSGQLSATGPVYRRVSAVPITALSLAQQAFAPPPPPADSPWSEALLKLNSLHSFDNNYEDKLSQIKMNYRARLEQLSSSSSAAGPWGGVKVIDFAHAFFEERDPPEVDANFRDGVDSLVAIFEDFLKETDDQVFWSS